MQGIVSGMVAFRDKYLFWLNIPSVTPTDVVEIILIAFLLYSILVWIKNTRAYAKRQLTWFNADSRIQWFAPNEGKEILTLVSEWQQRKKD